MLSPLPNMPHEESESAASIRFASAEARGAEMKEQFDSLPPAGQPAQPRSRDHAVVVQSSPIRTPKRDPASEGNAWYRFYAGFTSEFVSDVLRRLRLPSDALVLDPWNGSGTTTTTAHRLSYAARGFDANPALVIVARGRLLDTDLVASVLPLRNDILEHWDQSMLEEDRTDPLCAWFTPRAASGLRSLERAIFRLLVDSTSSSLLRDYEGFSQVSSLAAFFYVTLFRAIRRRLARFIGTNPTWVRVPTTPEDRISFPKPVLSKAFQAEVDALIARLHAPRSGRRPRAVVEQGLSSRLPLADGIVDCVITSPPYCTRIDYVVATLPELALLGYGRADTDELRRQMIGTPTVKGMNPAPEDADWGRTIRRFLAAVASHHSKASATYYLTYFRQYFAGMQRSLQELHRVSKPGTPSVVVVQDSFYKEIRNDVATGLSEMAGQVGWTVIERKDFPARRNKATMNTRARAYRTDFRATESVLVLRKESGI